MTLVATLVEINYIQIITVKVDDNMAEIYLLDCTLRDGGYVNNWEFGQEAIASIKTGLEDAGIDIIELGFFRDELWNRERTVFGGAEDVAPLLHRKKPGVIYSAMVEPKESDALYPVEKLLTPYESGIDYIRVCIWKRLMKEHMEYCGKIVEKGYRISIQPTAVGQYNEQEFVDLLKMANDAKPYALYIVDTWGTQSSFQICRFAELAEKYLDSDIKIGYHGHNNKMQALSCAEAIINMKLSHDICLDSSIMGMGRGVGNLQTEVIMEYLNENYGKRYDCLKIIPLYESCMKKFYERDPWGYSIYHYLSSVFNCSQDFATYFKQNRISESVFLKFLEGLTQHEKTVFNKKFVEVRLEEMRKAGII